MNPTFCASCGLYVPFVFIPDLLCKARGSEHVFEGELHNARIGGGRDLSELAAVQIGAWTSLADAVRNVERLGTNFQVIAFSNSEASGKRHVETPESRTQNVSASHRSDRAQSRLDERLRVEVVGERSIAIGILEDLMRALAAGGSAVQA